MTYRSLFCGVLFLSCLVAAAKDKKKALLPVDILKAHTAWVVVDPQADLDIKDPNANNVARADVESALAKWGRLSPVTDPALADLIIVVRKGTGKVVQETSPGGPLNNPPPVIGHRTDSGISVAGRAGPPPLESPDPHPRTEVGSAQDMFSVYRGGRYNEDLGSLLDSPAAWRYSAKDALAHPGVHAVDEFRKAIAESEKQLTKP